MHKSLSLSEDKYKPRPLKDGEIWKRCFHFEIAWSVFSPHSLYGEIKNQIITGHFEFVLGNLGRRNRMIIV